MTKREFVETQTAAHGNDFRDPADAVKWALALWAEIERQCPAPSCDHDWQGSSCKRCAAVRIWQEDAEDSMPMPEEIPKLARELHLRKIQNERIRQAVDNYD